MDILLQEIRYALRMLTKSPVFTGTVVLTLALGIGANTTIFSFVNALLFKGVPGVEMNGLAGIYTVRGTNTTVSSYMDYVDLRDQNEAFSGLAAFKPRLMDFGSGGVTERIQGLMVTGNYFSVLRAKSAAGRFILPDEDRLKDPRPVAVLSHGLWHSHFAADPGVLGSGVLLNGREFTVVGVAPAKFRGTRLYDRPQIFVPMTMQAHFMPESGYLLEHRGWGGISMLGRLLPNVSLAAAQAHLDTFGERLAAEYPRTNSNRRFGIAPLGEATLAPGDRANSMRFSLLLMGVVVLVLLIACVNVANLMLARAQRRGREIAVRQALGAARGRLVRQLLIESLLLALIGGGLGLLLAVWAADSLRLLNLPLELDFGLDRRILIFTFAVSIMASLIFGLVPALKTTRLKLAQTLRSDSATGAGSRRGPRLSHLLVAGQVALSLVLLVAAGLFTRTLMTLVGLDLGFSTETTLAATLDPALQGYTPEHTATFYDRLTESVSRLPGVEGVSRVSTLPGPLNDNNTTFSVRGYEPPDGQALSIGFGTVGRDYFQLLKIPLLEGRRFTTADDQGSPPVVVVNQAAARYLEAATGRDVLGQRLSNSGPAGPFMEVVGVAADSRLGSLRDEAHPFLYYFHPQVVDQGVSRMTLLVRTHGNPNSLAPQVRSEVAALDPNLPLFDVTTLDQHLSGLLAQERLSVTLLGLSACLALILASVGLYGVLAYSVSQRTHELGLRSALGAHRSDLVALVVRQGMGLAIVGLAAGLLAAILGGRLLTGFLYQTSSTDPLTLAIVSVLLLAVSLVASYLPARAATRVDPLRALRQE